MAYDAPDPAALKVRYPAFAAVEDETVQYWLTDAERFVDTGWIEADYAVAIMAKAAESMARQGLGVSASGDAALPAGVTSFRSGAMSVQISDSVAKQAATGGTAASIYAQEFAMLQRRSNGGPRVVAAPVPPCTPLCGYPVW